MKEWQRLQVGQVNVRDTTNVTIENPDGGQFTLYFQNPKDTTSLTQSNTLSTNMTAYDFYIATRGFYSNVWGAGISVYKYMYDLDGNLTTVASDSVKNVFQIVVLRSIPSASANVISVSRSTTTSKITV